MFTWFAVALLSACGPANTETQATPAVDDHALAPVPAPTADQEVAVLAGGCFWCLESDMDKLPGVISTTSGFAGGFMDHPTYQQVGMGGTGHTEAVYVIYDPAKVTYAQVLDYFWHHIDPTDAGGQFCDRGDQYRPAVFPQNEAQAAIASQSKADLAQSGVLPAPVATDVVSGQKFWPAEIYHQDYHDKESAHYLAYRTGCGRDAKVSEVWAKAPH